MSKPNGSFNPFKSETLYRHNGYGEADFKGVFYRRLTCPFSDEKHHTGLENEDGDEVFLQTVPGYMQPPNTQPLFKEEDDKENEFTKTYSWCGDQSEFERTFAEIKPKEKH